MKLSVAITTYNRWESCYLTLVSILEQSIEDIEVLLVDDASQDVITTSVASLLKSKGVKYFSHTTNCGLATARNTALDLASGDLFSFCDDDDRWPIGLGRRLTSSMSSAPPDVGMGIVLDEKFKKSCEKKFGKYPHLTSLMKFGVTPPVGSQIYRTELIRRIGGYRPEVKTGVDHDLWISLTRIDPRVAIAWDTPAIVDSNPSRKRMTTTENRRRSGINKSLMIWRSNLINVFGEPFYLHFKKSYQSYLDYSFFIMKIRKQEYYSAAGRAVCSPQLFYQVIKHFMKRIFGISQCNLFPAFKEQ